MPLCTKAGGHFRLGYTWYIFFADTEYNSTDFGHIAMLLQIVRNQARTANHRYKLLSSIRFVIEGQPGPRLVNLFCFALESLARKKNKPRVLSFEDGQDIPLNIVVP